MRQSLLEPPLPSPGLCPVGLQSLRAVPATTLLWLEAMHGHALVRAAAPFLVCCRTPLRWQDFKVR